MDWEKERRDHGGPEEKDALARTGESGGQANGNCLKIAKWKMMQIRATTQKYTSMPSQPARNQERLTDGLGGDFAGE